MSEQPTVITPEAPAGPAGVTDDQAAALLADAVAAADKVNAETPNASPWDDPAVAKAEIERLRKENGADRVNAKAQAATDARASMAQEIGKALGLIKGDEPADPAALTAQLTAAGADARQAKIELAVFRAAQATDADPSALLDSRAFLVKLADVDPSDAAAITAAVTEAVAANPRLGKPVTPGMKPNQAQGRSASAPLGLAEQIAVAEKAGDMKATIRLKAAMGLNNSN
jgi:hypothetical protein